LLLREVLDNPSRVAKASRLPLGPFLERASALVAARASANTLGSPEVTVLHLVGAISYFVAAWPTAARIVGDKRAAQIDESYEREAIAFARRMFGIAPLGARTVRSTATVDDPSEGRAAPPARTRARPRNPGGLA
jgi:hypothetical protein